MATAAERGRAERLPVGRARQERERSGVSDSFHPEFPIWRLVSGIICSSYPGHNEFVTRAGPSEVAGFRRLVFCPVPRQNSICRENGGILSGRQCAQSLINALSGEVGPRTQISGYPTYQALSPE